MFTRLASSHAPTVSYSLILQLVYLSERYVVPLNRILSGRFLRKLKVAHIPCLGETHVRVRCEEEPIKPICFKEKPGSHDRKTTDIFFKKRSFPELGASSGPWFPFHGASPGPWSPLLPSDGVQACDDALTSRPDRLQLLGFLGASRCTINNRRTLP